MCHNSPLEFRRFLLSQQTGYKSGTPEWNQTIITQTRILGSENHRRGYSLEGRGGSAPLPGGLKVPWRH